MPFIQQIKAHLFKVIAGAVGGFAYGTTGLGIGLLSGAIVDYLLNRPARGGTIPRTQLKMSSKDESKDFVASTILLAALVVKSDGELSELEIGYLRRFLSEQFGEQHTTEYLALLRASLGNEFDTVTTCANIAASNSYETRLQMLYIIVGVANADFNLQQAEIDKILQISNLLGIDKYDFKSILAMHRDELTAAYQILEIHPSASDTEVKKSYQNMAVKYHPDKLAHLGALAVNTAKLKHDKVIQAYESIKKERGFR